MAALTLDHLSGGRFVLGLGSFLLAHVAFVVAFGFTYWQNDAVLAAAVASGEGHSCGLATAGVVSCWGGNEFTG